MNKVVRCMSLVLSTQCPYNAVFPVPAAQLQHRYQSEHGAYPQCPDVSVIYFGEFLKECVPKVTPLGTNMAESYAVLRTAVGGNLPVYRKFRNGRGQVFTLIRCIQGNVQQLANDLHAELVPALPAQKLRRWRVRPDLQQIWMHGDHLLRVKEWLHSRGF